MKFGSLAFSQSQITPISSVRSVTITSGFLRRFVGAHAAAEAVGVFEQNRVDAAVLGEEARHRLERALLRPVGVGLAEQLQVLVLGDLFLGAFLPAGAERVARRATQLDDGRRVLLRLFQDYLVTNSVPSPQMFSAMAVTKSLPALPPT